MPKISFLWDEDKTRKLFRTHLILFFVGGLVASFYTLILPPSTPYRLIVILIPTIFTISTIPYMVNLGKPGVGWRFLLFTLEGQLAAAIFMAVTGGFLGIVQFAPIMFLLFSVFELGTDSTLILGGFSIFSFIIIYIWLRGSSAPNLFQDFFYYTGSYLLILIIERNIGKELSLQFEAKARLEQIDDMKNEFIALSSHYLRGPLSVIKLFSSGLSKVNLPAVQEHQLKMFNTSVKSLEDMTEKLLLISSIEKGQAVISPLPGNLNNLVKGCVNEFQPLAMEHQVKLSLQENGNDTSYSFDPVKLKQALATLIDNAIRYNKPEGKVDIDIRDDQKNFYIDVSDNGPGIKSEQLGRLFTPFSKGELEKSLKFDTPGMGLSLYLAKLIVESHKGILDVRSGEGVGSTFTITLTKVRS